MNAAMIPIGWNPLCGRFSPSFVEAKPSSHLPSTVTKKVSNGRFLLHILPDSYTQVFGDLFCFSSNSSPCALLWSASTRESACKSPKWMYAISVKQKNPVSEQSDHVYQLLLNINDLGVLLACFAITVEVKHRSLFIWSWLIMDSCLTFVVLHVKTRRTWSQAWGHKLVN